MQQLAKAAGLFFICAVPGLALAQSNPPASTQIPHAASRAVRPSKVAAPTDDLAGMQFTAEQNAKMDEIHKNMKKLMDAVVKDEKLSPEQKGAMLDGYRRMERNQVFQVLTAEQRAEVRKKILARRAAAREQNNNKQPPLPK